MSTFDLINVIEEQFLSLPLETNFKIEIEKVKEEKKRRNFFFFNI